MTTYKEKITFKELIEKYKFDPNDIRIFIGKMNKEDKLFLFCNHMLDSSHLGDANVLVVGPGRTFEKPPPHLDPYGSAGAPSRQQQFVGEIDVDDHELVAIGLEKLEK